jgi:hypothetical protein
MDICRSNRALYEKMRRLGEEMQRTPMSLAHLFFFSLPGSTTLVVKMTYSCLDLSTIKLVGGSEGLGEFWDTWSHCVKRI